MPLDRTPGRICGAHLGYPPQCSAYTSAALMPCGAELHRARCLLCVREGDLPMPAQWIGPGWSIVGTHSVQIIRDRDSWLVAVFLPQRWVNPRWPVVRFRTKADAIEGAHFRAGQLRPGRRIVPERDERDSWKCGDLVIWCAQNG